MDPALMVALEQEWSTGIRAAIETLREVAESTLAAVLAGPHPPPDDEDFAISHDIGKHGLRYAAAVVREGRLPAAQQDPGTFIRDLVPDEVRLLLLDFSLYRSEKADARVTPEILFRRWEARVERAEGQRYESEEYTELAFDLERRDTLEDALLCLPLSARRAVTELVVPLDERYERATRHGVEPVYGPSAPWRQRAWWWYRRPGGRTR